MQSTKFTQSLFFILGQAFGSNEDLLKRVKQDANASESNFIYSIDDKKLRDELCDLCDKLSEELVSALESDITFDLGGHCKGHLDGLTLKALNNKLSWNPMNNEFIATSLMEHVGEILLKILFKKIDLSSITHEETLSEISGYKRFGHIRLSEATTCCTCGERIRLQLNPTSLKVSLDEKVIRINGKLVRKTIEPCEFPSGLGAYSTKISCPSGKIVFGNAITRLLDRDANRTDQREYISEKSSGREHGVCSDLGKKLNAEYYSEVHSIAYMQTGNTSLDGYLNKETGVITFKDDIVFVDDAEVSTVKPSEESVCYVCCDLWAVTACDLEVFSALAEKSGKSLNDALEVVGDGTIVDVESGTYEFTSYYSEKNPDDLGNETLFTVKRCSN